MQAKQTKKTTKTTAKNADLGKKSLDLRTSPTDSSDKPQPAQNFTLESTYSPAGDQPQAIDKITRSFSSF